MYHYLGVIYLAAAVLKRAKDDMEGKIESLKKGNKTHYYEYCRNCQIDASRWIWNREETFDLWCDILNTEPEYIKRLLLSLPYELRNNT